METARQAWTQAYNLRMKPAGSDVRPAYDFRPGRDSGHKRRTSPKVYRARSSHAAVLELPNSGLNRRTLRRRPAPYIENRRSPHSNRLALLLTAYAMNDENHRSIARRARSRRVRWTGSGVYHSARFPRSRKPAGSAT